MNFISEKIDWTTASLGFMLPEMIIAFGLLLLIVVGLFTKNGEVARIFSLVILSISIILFLINGPPITKPISLFGGMLKLDGFNFYLRTLIGVSGLLIVLLSEVRTITKNPFEYFVLVLSIVLGAELLVTSEHFAMIILSVELMSIPAYVLAGFAFDKAAAEASMKYFIYGSVATAIMIFGISWIYGLSDTLVFSSIGFSEKLKFNDNEIFLAAGLMVMAGLLFKMAAAPFHFWTPDVFESAPMSGIALFSTIPKIAAGAVLIKMAFAFGLNGGTRYDWQTILTILAVATLTVGNFSALWQKNAKRLMAYSSIGQAGFLLVAITTLTESSSKFFLFYSTVLVLSNVLVFIMLEYFESQHRAKNITDFQGLGRQSPIMAVLLLIGMLSLVGLPITAGFTAKLLIFSGLLEAWSQTQKDVLLWLFAFGLLNTAVSLYYYLRIPFFLFKPEALADSQIKKADLEQTKLEWYEKRTFTLVFGILLAAALLWFFFQPNILMGLMQL